MLSSLSLGIIKFFRRIFVHTPINSWTITSKIKGAIFQAGHKGEEIEISYKGIKLIAPTSDRALVPGLVGGYYESYELDVYKKIVANSKVTLDVGGNIGLYAVLGAKFAPKTAKIITFEPIVANVIMLKKNAALNKLTSRIVVNNVAVGDTPKKIVIYQSDVNIGNHSAAQSNAGKGSRPVEVQQITIDNYVKKNNVNNVDLLKIDIEGYDGFALRGALATIKKHKPVVFIEFSPGAMKECGFDRREFTRLLFANYTTCFRVDEINNKLETVTKKQLDDMPVYSNENLIFTSKKKLF